MPDNKRNITGYIHSLQSMGAVDGPGIRYCVFLQGCPLRCMYCHNPDTWLVTHRLEDGSESYFGTPYTAEELVRKILRYKTYFANGGGVTVSGGEPLMQAEFVTELFTLLHENDIHTCLDTSGNFPEDLSELDKVLISNPDILETNENDQKSCADAGIVNVFNESAAYSKYRKLLEVTDLVICDIKFTTERAYRENTGGSLKKVQFFLDMVTKYSVPLWIRHVVVPGYTDSEEEVSEMAAMAHSYPTLEKIELLPFHKLCIPKYEALGIPFRCADIPECSKETIDKLNKIPCGKSLSEEK